MKTKGIFDFERGAQKLTEGLDGHKYLAMIKGGVETGHDVDEADARRFVSQYDDTPSGKTLETTVAIGNMGANNLVAFGFESLVVLEFFDEAAGSVRIDELLQCLGVENIEDLLSLVDEAIYGTVNTISGAASKESAFDFTGGFYG